jgi:ketosteroid isomerase-like protein
MKKNNTVWVVLCLALPFIYNNCGAQTNKGMDLISVKKIIETNNALYFDLFSKNDVSIVNLYTEDGCLMIPNEPSKCGRTALEKDFKDTYAAGKIRGVKFITQNIYGDGKDYITEEGNWQVLDLKGKMIDDGKYLKLWKKTKEGWKIFKDLFNSNHSSM